MNNYTQHVKRSENKTYTSPRKRANTEHLMRLLHGGMGLVTESAELLDTLKRHIFYGVDIDIVNIKEELGDIEWYSAIIRDELKVSQETIQELNILKLAKRYNNEFSEHNAVNRNLDIEREVLEK